MANFNFPKTGRLIITLTLSVLLSRSIFAQSLEQFQSDHLLKVDLLYVGAHPDDESGSIATMAREVLDGGQRAAIVLVTRGEGGGNAIGQELGTSLGLLREAEIRRSASEYGVDLIYFLDKTDFFYTLSAEAVFNVWGYKDTLSRLVRLIRLLRPEVIVTMWPGPGTHGMHQAVARLATEAFAVAGDPENFPEQIDNEFLRTWQPLKLYYNAKRPGALAIPTGDISSSRLLTYAEIKNLALQKFRSQGFDRSIALPVREASEEFFLLAKTLVSETTESEIRLTGKNYQREKTKNTSVLPFRLEPISVSIVPRADVLRFNLWAERHELVSVLEKPDPAVSIGSGTAGILNVEVINRHPTTISGNLKIDLPNNWIGPSSKTEYIIRGNEKKSLPFLITVPKEIEQGSYPVRVSTNYDDKSFMDNGWVDVLPVMDLLPRQDDLVIDGSLAEWSRHQTHAISSEYLWSGTLPGGDKDCSAIFNTAYDKNNLYVAVDVQDDVVVCNIKPTDIKGHWRSDSVEISVDPSGQSENTLTVFKVGIFPCTTEGDCARAARDADARQGIIEKTAPGMKVASRLTDRGYTIEASIPWSDMPGDIALGPERAIGFNIMIYDGDDTTAGPGANIGKARLAWSYRPSVQALPYYYGRAIMR